MKKGVLVIGLLLILFGNILFVSSNSEPIEQVWNKIDSELGSGAWGIATDPLGNVYVTGNSGYHGDFVTIKYYLNGTKAWNQTYGEIEDGSEWGIKITVDSERNVYVIGNTRSTSLIKYNGSNGNLIWNKTLENYFYARGLVLDLSDNIYVTGAYSLTDEKKMFLRKYYPNGTEIWNKTWGGKNSIRAGGTSVTIDSLGNIYVGGYTYYVINSESNWDVLIIKYYPNGTEIWNKTYARGHQDFCTGIVADPFDNLYVVGHSLLANYWDPPNPFLLKYYPNGTEIWNKIINVPYFNNYWRDITIDYSGNIYIIGNKQLYVEGHYHTDMWLVMYYPNGTEIWNKTSGGEDNDVGSGITKDLFGNIYSTGKYALGGGNTAIWTTKYNSNCQQFIDKQSCWNSLSQCTWSPPGTENVVGQCCPSGTTWEEGNCVAGRDICTAPFTAQIKSNLQIKAILQEELYTINGPINEEETKSCLQISKETNYGFWYDIEIY